MIIESKLTLQNEAMRLGSKIPLYVPRIPKSASPIRMASYRNLARPLAANGARIPRLIYGTAWKKERTADLVTEALASGFTGIDTACQPKHYREDLVGEGIGKAIRDGVISREALYVQTKFTSFLGQDPHNVPYDPASSLESQVDKSIATSLQNLSQAHTGAPYIDTMVLHSPLETMELTVRAWRALEQHVPHDVRALGVSNIEARELEILYEAALVKPIVVQNRFHARTAWDSEVRTYCEEKNMVYQSFWTLTANPSLLKSEVVSNVAQAVNVTREAALYLCVLSLGNVSVLNGTTNKQRMTEDIASLRKWDKWIGEGNNGEVAERLMRDFQTMIGVVRRVD